MRVLLIPLILWTVAAVYVESRPQPLPIDEKNTNTSVKGISTSPAPSPVVPEVTSDGQSEPLVSSAAGEPEKSNAASEDTTPVPKPTEGPTAEPTEGPTVEPTEEPTVEPTEEPTVRPTEEPTAEPTAEPTSEGPNNTTSATTEYTTEPTAAPSHRDKRSFDGWSFFGGILLTLGVMTVLMVGFRYYKARTGGGSVGYNRAPDI